MEVFSGSRVLVTGHTGFKGSWLVSMLRHFGAEVFGISTNTGQVPPILKNEFKDGHEFNLDIRDREILAKTIDSIRPKLIFHLAAQSLVIDSYSKPVETFDINVIGTMNVLNAIETDSEVRGIVVATTDKVYRNLEKGNHFTEEDPLGGVDPYSASKSCASILLSAWQNLPNFEKTKIIEVRAGNVIGGGDRAANRLLPDLVKAAIHDEPVYIRNPNSIRPWQHVLEPLHGYLLAGEKIMLGADVQTSYNFGPGLDSELTVWEVAKIFNEEFPGLYLNSSAPGVLKSKESQILNLNSTRALQDLNWKSELSPSEAVKMSIRWEKAIDSRQLTPLEATQMQISEYYSRNL
jgi:CDP-glucose 4,6-dehydratase